MQFIALGKATQLTLGVGPALPLDSMMGTCMPANGFYDEAVCKG
jgi:hypothetical protein